MLQPEWDALRVGRGDDRGQGFFERVCGGFPRELAGRAGREDHALSAYGFGGVERAAQPVALAVPLRGVVELERTDPDEVRHAHARVAQPASALFDAGGFELRQRRADRGDAGALVERQVVVERPAEGRDRRERDSRVHCHVSRV